VEAAFVRHALAGEQSADDRERLVEARDVVVERQAERAELLLVPPGAEGSNKPTAAQFVDGSRLPGEDSRRVECGARDERADLDVLRDSREPRERRPAIPRPPLRAAVAAVEQVVAHPDRVEAALLDCSRHRCKLGPAHLALDFGELDADPHAQKRSNASKSNATAVTSAIWPSRTSQKSAW